MKVLVSGANGFIGKVFLNEYAHEFNLNTVQVRPNEPFHFSCEDIDAIVHLAGLAHQMKGAPEDAYFKSNYELTKNLAQKAKDEGVKHFIYISTAHVFGQQGDLMPNSPPLTESSPCFPSEAYGKSKLMAENALFAMASQDFLVSIIRPPLVYGEGAKGNIPRLFKLIKLFPILPFGYDSNKRSMIYVSNLTFFINCVLKSQATGVLLPQDSEPLTLKKLVTLILKINSVRRILLNPGQIGIRILNTISPSNTRRLFGSLYFNSSESNNKTGYQAIYTTEEGLRQMAQTFNF
ncbi:MAG: NAD-dependent epimerase/dehydratase family protein [Bdellovibrio sp.]